MLQGRCLQAQDGSAPHEVSRRSANLPLCLSESWKVDLAGQIQNCEFPTRGLGFQLVPLFDVPQDEIMDVPPSSAQNGELKYPKRGGIAGMFQVDADGDKVAFRSPFMRSGCHLQAWENNPLRCANTHFGEWEKWVLKPSVPKWKSQTRLQLVNCQWPERALQHTVRPVCFVSKDAFLASQTQEGLKQDAHILDTKEALDDALDALASMYAERAQMQAKQNQMQHELDDLRANNTREYERVQDNTRKLLPWTLSMAPLFIDPMKLMRGTPLGVTSSGAKTYSGTYEWTDNSQPMQTVDLQNQVDKAAFEEWVHMLRWTSADSHHICRIHGVSSLNEQACFVMKLYPDSLASEMRTISGDRQKLPVSMVIQRGIDMCQGLQDLHAAGIVMGSLSQANVS
ncbi:TPA: hypothetical protein ACH3X3_007578 [Trebouxia sp. C0006]